MFGQGFAGTCRLMLLALLLCSAAAATLAVYQHWDENPARPTLAKGTALSVYRMQCASAGNVDGEHPGWRRYEVTYDPAQKQFILDTSGKPTVLPPVLIAGPVSPDNTDYFMVLTQSQLNTANGVSIVNLQAVLPMKASLANQPLSFKMSLPRGQVLRSDACTVID